MPLKEVDAIALFCDGVMIDYLSWSSDGVSFTDDLHKAAIASGMWNEFDEHVETGDIKRGKSIRRDANSRNTHSMLDWSFPGGADIDRATPSAQNKPTASSTSTLPNLIELLSSVSFDNGTALQMPLTPQKQ